MHLYIQNMHFFLFSKMVTLLFFILFYQYYFNTIELFHTYNYKFNFYTKIVLSNLRLN